MIHPAATLVLLRERSGTLEALMLRRHSAVAFLGGMWVFPGGRLDAADQSPEARARVLPLAPGTRLDRYTTIQGSALDAGTIVGLHVAACREAFEEAGVLMACDAAGKPCDAGTAARLAPRRAEITSDAGAFLRMLESEGLYLDVGRLLYWSHWITPSFEPKRFDTRFFVTELPGDQEASADLSELTEHAWIEPAAAAGAVERGEIRAIPPTLLTLEDLAESHARHGSLQAMLAAEAGRETPPLMPKMELTADAAHIVMPWDARYDAIAGEGCGSASGFPAHVAQRPSIVTIKLPRGAQATKKAP